MKTERSLTSASRPYIPKYITTIYSSCCTGPHPTIRHDISNELKHREN